MARSGNDSQSTRTFILCVMGVGGLLVEEASPSYFFGGNEEKELGVRRYTNIYIYIYTKTNF